MPPTPRCDLGQQRPDPQITIDPLWEAGVSLEGSTLRQDNSANRKLYGRELSAREIVSGGKAAVPAAGQEMVAILRQHSPRNLSDPKSLR